MIWTWGLFLSVAAASVSDLVGTWTTKSREVYTGPGFFDPLNDKLLEPNLTGISYSFDESGHYEEALYRAIANPTNPSCPTGIMQWQHGTYVLSADGSLILNPIKVDGRQLLSDPCTGDVGLYTRYNVTEHFKGFSVSVDRYYNRHRLDLTQANGEIMHPMYLAYKPPQMLPTNTLNPMPTGSRKKRDLSSPQGPGFNLVIKEELMNPDRWWWLGVFMTSLGGMAFFFS